MFWLNMIPQCMKYEICYGCPTILTLILLLPPSYPDREQLQTIYGAYLLPVLQKSLGERSAWGTPGKAHQLAASLLQVYEQVRASRAALWQG